MSNSSTSFLTQFLRHPVQTGAILPSSRFLAKAMVEWLDLASAHSVLEYGSGTGPFTPHILRRLKQNCRFVAIERNANLAEAFRARLPKVRLVEDSVENVRAICTAESIEFVDCIVCGLPWAAFPDDLQKRLLDSMMTVLRPGGQFVTFAYLHGLPLPAGRKFANRLPEYFREVRRSSTVWMNVPPALVYRCRR
jgi:phosphatidylethanolamine/phosphatidyl-N-methylethanolamine N-methyltransferase